MNVKKCGFLILDRKGEYVEDVQDHFGNTVSGLQHHPKAKEKMVIVSARELFSEWKNKRVIHDYLNLQFNIKDIDPIDLADFLRGLTQQQANLVRDYAHVPQFYEKLLAENYFGGIDKSDWHKHFEGLIELNKTGKTKLKEIIKKAKAVGRTEMTPDECSELEEFSGGSKPALLERVILALHRFCLNPSFGGSGRGADILKAPSCVKAVLDHLADGKFVFIDLRGHSDQEYTLISALFARKLLTENKKKSDEEQIRACIIMEEAQNILSEDELDKGENGSGSVFIEFAREGRTSKLGFVLVTQQPNAKSIDPQVADTIDTIVAFNMPPSNAKQLQRLKPGFADLELEISNAKEFRGVAISDAGPVSFQSAVVDKPFMEACTNGTLESNFRDRGDVEISNVNELDTPPIMTLEERLAALMRKRQEDIQPIALATMKAWGRERLTEDSDDLPF